MNKMQKNSNTLKWLFSVPKKKKWYILFLIIIQALHGGSGVLYALFLRNIVDSAAQKNTDGFFLNILYIVLLVIAQLMMRAGIRFLNELSRSTLENIFKKRLADALLKKDFASVDAVHSGEWLNRLTSDTVVVANSYTEILPGLSGMSVKMVSAVIMIIVLQPWFACILIPGGILMVLITYAFRKKLKKLHKNVQEKDGQLRIYLQEMLGNMMMIRSFAAQEQCSDELTEKMAVHKKARMKKNRFSNLSNVGLGTAVNGMYLIGVCYCGWGILTGTITYGTLTAVTQLITQIQAPFANITGYLPKFYAMTASAERLMEIEDFSDDSSGVPASYDKIIKLYDNDLISFGLSDVSFTYYPPSDSVSDITKQNMPVVVNNISLSINKGEYVAFTGHSGCGKSTVIKLLMSIYRPDSGQCFFQTASGREELTADMHRLFAYVPQGNKLMTGTVRESVTFSDKSEMDDDEKIMNALRIACADKFVSELENGIDTLLGERGAGLSEGQTQRIAIARAIFSASPVLILDEATSALDSITEKNLLENLRSMTDKTVIIVTHRPAALKICDRIIRFTENGVSENE